MANPRGLRNNNPLNIRRRRSKWLGEVDSLNGRRDRSFCQFSSLTYGYRAAAKQLRKYQTSLKCKTLAQFIHRWAPTSENNTQGYIDRVAKALAEVTGRQISGETTLDLVHDKRLLKQLIIAMHEVENGQLPTPTEMQAIDQALSML